MFQHCPASQSLANMTVVPISLDRVGRDQQFADSVDKRGIADVVQFLAY